MTLVVVSDDKTECELRDRHPIDKVIGQAHHVNGGVLGPSLSQPIERTAHVRDAHLAHDRGQHAFFPHQIFPCGCCTRQQEKKNAAGTHSWSLRRSIMVATSVATFMLDATESQRATVAGICAIQRSMGMNPRDDSLLTVNYALGQTGSLYKSPYEVAQDLTAVDLIYETTLYAEIVEDLMRCIAAWIEAAYGLPWGDVWALVRAFAPTMIKLYCVDACPALIQTPCVRRPRADSPPHLGPSEPLARAYSQSIADELRFSEDQRGAESP